MDVILRDLGLSFVFGLLGIIMMVLGYLIFDKVMPADFNKELEKNNISVGIVVAAFIIGIALIISRVVGA